MSSLKRVDGSVIESGALIGENEDESANERFHRGGETQLASPSSTQYEVNYQYIC